MGKISCGHVDLTADSNILAGPMRLVLPSAWASWSFGFCDTAKILATVMARRP